MVLFCKKSTGNSWTTKVPGPAAELGGASSLLQKWTSGHLHGPLPTDLLWQLTEIEHSMCPQSLAPADCSEMCYKMHSENQLIDLWISTLECHKLHVFWKISVAGWRWPPPSLRAESMRESTWGPFHQHGPKEHLPRLQELRWDQASLGIVNFAILIIVSIWYQCCSQPISSYNL